MDKLRAEALPHELLCRVQNLFPDVCHLCNLDFCVTLQDNPIAHCANCGQGCHNSCVLQLLNLSEEDLSEENENGAKLLNPHSAIGLVYLCGACQRDILPQKARLKSKSSTVASGSTRPSENQPQSNSQSESTRIQTQTETATDEAGLTPADDNTGSRIDEASQSVAGDTEHQNSPEDGLSSSQEPTVGASQPNHMQDSSQSHSARQAGSQTTATNQNPPSICRFYKEGRCKHGTSGKKDGICPFSHPKVCHKFIANGPKGRRGCSKQNCKFFHPKLCKFSVNDRTCFRDDCKFNHLRGTKRSREPDAQSAQPRSTEAKSGDGRRSLKNVQVNPPNPSLQNTDMNNHFLDQIKAINNQMLQISNKLQHMDANYNNIQLQLQSSTNQQPRFPLLQYPMYPQWPTLTPYQQQFQRLGPGQIPSPQGSQ